MNIDENIKNALQVLYHTYDNVNKLMESCSLNAKEAGYVPAVQKFLRWKSDNSPSGWLLNSFILLFQDARDPLIETNGWRNGPVYVMEICLGKKEEPTYLPKVHLSRFDYDNIKDWSPGCSPASHWVFYYPVNGNEVVNVTLEGTYRIAVPNSEKNGQTYWGLKRVTTISVNLTDIRSDNLRELVFGTFDQLKTKTDISANG